MKPAVGGVKKIQFSPLFDPVAQFDSSQNGPTSQVGLEHIHNPTISYTNGQEGCPCFHFNHFIYLDHKQFMKISH